MAENLQLLKKRIRTAQNIAQIAKAMEMIAASKIKRAQAAVEHNRPYARRITETVEHIMANVDLGDFEHPYIDRTAGGKRLLVLIAPDKGLCGGLPTNLLRAFSAHAGPDDLVLTIGKKAERLAARLDRPLAASFPMGTAFPGYGAVFPVIEIIDRAFREGSVARVDLLYTEFTSMLAQAPVLMPLLPVVAPLAVPHGSTQYLFEPSPGAVLHDLLPRYIEAKVFTALVQAFTAEQAARMVAMRNAKDNAVDIGYALTNRYNRSRQERITNEILDLANGAA